MNVMSLTSTLGMFGGSIRFYENQNTFSENCISSVIGATVGGAVGCVSGFVVVVSGPFVIFPITTGVMITSVLAVTKPLKDPFNQI
jgi:hypothetical protein